MQHAVCHVVRRDSSAIKFDNLNRIYVSFVLLPETSKRTALYKLDLLLSLSLLLLLLRRELRPFCTKYMFRGPETNKNV